MRLVSRKKVVPVDMGFPEIVLKMLEHLEARIQHIPNIHNLVSVAVKDEN